MHIAQFILYITCKTVNYSYSFKGFYSLLDVIVS